MKITNKQFNLLMIFIGITLVLCLALSVSDSARNLHKIDTNAVSWIKDSTFTAVQVLHHETRETKDGGKICYRVIHINQTVDVTCLGWDDHEKKIVHLETYAL